MIFASYSAAFLFSVSGFIFALVTFMVWVYVLGVIYALVRNWL